ncbi:MULTISPECIES: DUF2637 domain-containing protein [Streptomyces]|uniref:DUF2637 domain-containing protein n=1 Tax=Streptomyces tsukubensis (strain DSM 42081 / NBRC 108919 / NRRL 18488 / 9993) TaxID=1114943 RepID=I2N1R9_STRT9|nr:MULTISPECIES: DUF2637 domain-containing protein [Streptomyces]AZK95123.1 SpdA protein [Streptomyces tsukubensis]EIF90966.1 mobile element transfer protein [Streptomyces tsukubensis NRRL18488]MYS64199.1 DUF2637 domain-containing protein [Streptomyces sp. SID5473]QKM68812.1 DUF2637 domain-containing protein [Streptomyces tsukubensis NRRL18488]TAI43616.1 DUF2637 domain-containing protein [Streptomyces tsukubensis]
MRARLARVNAVLVQAVIAAVLSFAHLHDLAVAAGQDGWKAWAYPVSVDLLMVAAWRKLRAGESRAVAWCWFLIALAASLGANIATAGLLDLDDVPAWLRITVAGWPALAFLGGTLLAHTTAPTEPEPDPVPAAALPPPPAVPAALVAHARKIAAEHRTRTGQHIDPSALRARLGVPQPMADAIATHLREERSP